VNSLLVAAILGMRVQVFANPFSGNQSCRIPVLLLLCHQMSPFGVIGLTAHEVRKNQKEQEVAFLDGRAICEQSGQIDQEVIFVDIAAMQSLQFG